MWITRVLSRLRGNTNKDFRAGSLRFPMMSGDPAPQGVLSPKGPCGNLPTGRALFVGGSRTGTADLQRLLRSCDVGINRVADLHDAFHHIRDDEANTAFVVVALDACGGPTKAIDPLMALRQRYPHIPVMLTSGEVLHDDLSTTRLMIADVVLREPVSQGAATTGLRVLASNNAVWRSRLTSMKPPSSKGGRPMPEQPARPGVAAAVRVAKAARDNVTLHPTLKEKLAS